MVGWLTWDRASPLGESGGLTVVKSTESDVKSRHLQGCSPCLCRLSTDGLTPVSKYWTYWSHAGDMGPTNRYSMVINRCLAYAHCFNGCVGRETEVGPVGHSFKLRGGVDSTFFSGAVNLSNFVGSAWKVVTYGDFSQEAYVSCVSGFPYRMYIIQITATLGYK
jgi:hypothetical protein